LLKQGGQRLPDLGIVIDNGNPGLWGGTCHDQAMSRHGHSRQAS
jgi:hypothetical protein